MNDAPGFAIGINRRRRNYPIHLSVHSLSPLILYSQRAAKSKVVGRSCRTWIETHKRWNKNPTFNWNFSTNSSCCLREGLTNGTFQNNEVSLQVFNLCSPEPFKSITIPALSQCSVCTCVAKAGSKIVTQTIPRPLHNANDFHHYNKHSHEEQIFENLHGFIPFI